VRNQDIIDAALACRSGSMRDKGLLYMRAVCGQLKGSSHLVSLGRQQIASLFTMPL